MVAFCGRTRRWRRWGQIDGQERLNLAGVYDDGLSGALVNVAVEENGKIDESRHGARRGWGLRRRRWLPRGDICRSSGARRGGQRSPQANKVAARTVIRRTHRRDFQGCGDFGLQCDRLETGNDCIPRRFGRRHVGRRRRIHRCAGAQEEKEHSNAGRSHVGKADDWRSVGHAPVLEKDVPERKLLDEPVAQENLPETNIWTASSRKT